MLKPLPILCLLMAMHCIAYSQTFSPDPGVQVCPNTEMTYTVTDVDGTQLTPISNTGFASFVSGLDMNGNFYIQVIFKDAAASVVLENTTTSVTKTIKFNVATLVGVTPAFSTPAPHASPPYADIKDIPICTTQSYTFEGPQVFYQYNGANSGVGMTIYNYLVPKGWSVNGTLSNGTTPITGEATATIVSDATTGGIMQYWALNNCSPSTLSGSNKMMILLQRPSNGSITVNGSTAVTVTCGQQTPVTFTAGVDDCITGYQWSAPAGWLDANGNPVTGAITTTTNTLTLIPQAAVAPSNVSVTMMENGSVLTGDTYTETVQYITNPLPTSISGPTRLCGAGPFVYTVEGVPAGSTPTFSLNTDGLTGSVTQSVSGNTLTITVTDPDVATGLLDVIATTPTECGNSVAELTSSVGLTPPLLDIAFTNGEILGANIPYSFTMRALASPEEPAIAWNWAVSPHVTLSGQNTTTVHFTGPTIPWGSRGEIDMYLKFETACGWSPTTHLYFIPANDGTPEGPPQPEIAGMESVQVMSASGRAAITTEGPVDRSAGKGISLSSTIRSAVVFNTIGQVQKKVIFGGNNKMEYLDLSDLSNGIYFIQIITSRGVVTRKYMVAH